MTEILKPKITSKIHGFPDIDWYVDDLIPNDKIFFYDKSKVYIEHDLKTNKRKLVIRK